MIPEARDIRKAILAVSAQSGHGHIPTCFSIVEMLCAVYAVMRHDPRKPDWDERDLFVLSKGHGALAHYSVLSHYGYFPPERVSTLGAFRSDFGCHADRAKVPGVEVSTGSLGHGIGVAAGMALALQIGGGNRRVYTLVGDGESNEGTVWEAVMVAVNLKLSNFTILYDDNRSQSRGLQIQDPAAVFRSFGCETAVVDGHDVKALIREISLRGTAPRAIVARTRKGYGCATLMDNHHAWHRRSPDKNEYAVLREELDAETI